MRRTKEDAETTRQLLLDAALRVFSKQGFAQTRLEDIAHEANVTRGAIYHHFGGKAEIYNSLIATRFGQASQLLHEIMAQQTSPLTTLRNMAISMLHLLADDPEYRAVQEMVIFKTPITPDLAEGLAHKIQATRSLIDYLSGLIQQGIEQGEVNAQIDPTSAALAFIGLVNGVSTLWLLDQELFTLHTQAAVIIETYIHGLTK